MLVRTKDHLYTSTLLTAVPGLVHGYSSRQWGDMKHKPANRRKMMDILFPAGNHLIMAEQMHDSVVAVVPSQKRLEVVPGADALIAKKQGAKVALGVVVADCVPLLLADPESGTIATVHAGWKGILGSIVPKTIAAMIDFGVRAENLVGAIGPHIGMCHYDVPQDRAEKFLEVFAGEEKIASFFEGAWRVDLGAAVLRQLLNSGLTLSHIDAAITCTACQNDLFFSYRIDSKETFGEILGVIGFS